MLNRLVAGSPLRKTRLHSQRGDFIPPGRLLRNGPKTLLHGFARVVLNIRQPRPWISYDAQAVIARHLGPESHVLEFGSGMSTAWYAERAASVFSIDHVPEWFAKVSRAVPSNATVKLATTVEEYTDFPRRSYDLIMVDGTFRVPCVIAALPHLAPGGIFYLDNSDRQGDYADALELLLRYAEEHDCEVRRFTDFVTAQLFVEEGFMLRRARGHTSPTARVFVAK